MEETTAVAEADLSTKTVDDIDSVLGPRDERFFGDGYRRVIQTLDEERTSWDGDEPRLAACARVDFPSDWSTKSGRGQEPHLTTIDAIVLAAQACKYALIQLGGADLAAKARIRKFEIRAGKDPLEAGFDQVPVSLVEADSGAAERVFVVHVGPIRVRCEIVTHLASGRAGDRDLEWLQYQGAFRSHQQRLRNLTIDVDQAEASADLIVDVGLGTEESQPKARSDSPLDEPLSTLDAFVACLQLGQTVLYSIDGFTRAESSTLWMRAASLLAPAAPVPLPLSDRVLVKAENPTLLSASGATWRTANLRGTVGAVEVTCSVAHKIPDDRSAGHHRDPQE